MSRARDRADGVLHNRTHEDTEGGRESLITFKGEQSGGEISTLAQIQASHDGTSDDEKADLIFKTNDGSDGSSPTTAMTIDSAQNVGIGTSFPSTRVHIVPPDNTTANKITQSFGSARANGNDVIAGGFDSEFVTRDGNVNTGAFIRVIDTSTHPSFPTTIRGGAISFGTVDGTSGATADATERMRILPTGGLTFNGDTAEANALDDYEEGTFTPQWSGYPTGYAGTEGRYTKIGNTVTVHVQLVTGTSADYSGVGLDNLPFTAANVNGVGSGMAWCDNTTFYDFKTATNVVKNTTTCALNMVNNGGFTSMEYVGRTPQLGASGTFQWTIIYQAA